MPFICFFGAVGFLVAGPTGIALGVIVASIALLVNEIFTYMRYAAKAWLKKKATDVASRS